MSEPEIDIAALVEAGARAAWSDPGSHGDERPDWDDLVGLLGEEGKAAQDTFRSQARAILTAVLPLVLAGPRLDLSEFDRLSLVIESAVRNADPTNRPAILGLIDRTRSTLTRIEALLKDESRGTEDG